MDKRFVDDFTYHVARVGKQWGLGEPAGRIWGIIMLNTNPLTQKEIAKQSNYSLGLVSPNLRVLESRGIIKVAGSKGKEKLYHPATGIADSFEKLMKSFHDIEIKPVTELIEKSISLAEDEQVAGRLTSLLKDYKRMALVLGVFSKLMLRKNYGLERLKKALTIQG